MSKHFDVDPKLLNLPVYSATGDCLGYVQDLRAEQDGPVMGSWGSAIRVKALIVTPRRWAATIGYEAGHSQGPYVLRSAANLLHRKAIIVPWEHIEQFDTKRIDLFAHADAKKL